MSVGQIVPGQRAMWKLAEKLGEGDAGEVFLIESTLQGKQAILKRPRKGAYSSDILRQAAQIRSEGSILRALSEVSFSSQVVHLSTPAVLDESRPEDGGGERYFIIIERASGIDLKSLRQISHFGVLESIQSLAGEENRFFIEKIARFGQIPEPILIRILGGVIHLLETIHSSHRFDAICSIGTRSTESTTFGGPGSCFFGTVRTIVRLFAFRALTGSFFFLCMLVLVG